MGTCSSFKRERAHSWIPPTSNWGVGVPQPWFIVISGVDSNLCVYQRAAEMVKTGTMAAALGCPPLATQHEDGVSEPKDSVSPSKSA